MTARTGERAADDPLKAGALALRELEKQARYYEETDRAEFHSERLADLRALIAERDALADERDYLEREVAGIERERDVARQACENLTAMRDAALAQVDELRDALRAMLYGPNDTCVSALMHAKRVLRATEGGGK